jgi:hypothetical protein
VLQSSYVRAMETYVAVGGDVFEYTPELETADYVRFLAPLRLDQRGLTPFHYRGERDQGGTSDEMWAAYHRVKSVGGAETE